MKNRIIIAAIFTACLALCAAVWPHGNAVEETPVQTQTPAVCAAETTVAELKTEVQTTPPA